MYEFKSFHLVQILLINKQGPIYFETIHVSAKLHIILLIHPRNGIVIK